MPKAYDVKSHDIGFLRADGTTKVGMMLVKDSKSIPQYSVFDRKNLADQFFTGVPGQQYVNPEEELPLIQNDWRAGLGLEVYDSADPTRYRTSTMDMRFKGMGIAGTKSTAITSFLVMSGSASLINTDMEATTGWTGGSRSNTQAHGGTYSWMVNGATATQDALTWDNSWRNNSFTFTCWVYSATVDRGRIGIYDGIGTTWSSYHTGNSTWQQLTVTRVLSATATILTINLDSQVVQSYFDDCTITTTAVAGVGAATCHAEFNSLMYASFGAVLAKLKTDGTAFDFVTVLPANITALEPMNISGTDYLFIALGTSTDYQYMVAAETFTTSTAAVKQFKYFKVVNAATPVMWGSDGANTIRSTVNPLNRAEPIWSGQTTVDSPAHAITALNTDSGSLYINKGNIPYYLNSTGAVKTDLAPELATLAYSTDNGKGASFWLHNYYLPWGYSLLENDGSTNTWRSPNDYSTQLADFSGQVFAVAGDDRYFYCIVDNSTKIEVLAGRLENIDGTTKWVWHCINETTLTGCESAWVSSVYQKRLWISSTNSSDSLYYIPLPLAYGNVLADANRSFQTATVMETSWLHGEFWSELKSFIKLTLEMGHTYDADIYFTVKYKKLGDTSWTTIGNFTGSATSMIQTRYIPVDSGSNKPTSTLFKLQFTAVTDDVQKTPVLLNYNLKAVLYPTKGSIIAMKIRCSKNPIPLRDGNLADGEYDTVIATLDEARAATYPLTMYDLDGNTLTVKLLSMSTQQSPGLPYWQPVTNEANQQYERIYNVMAEVIPVS